MTTKNDNPTSKKEDGTKEVGIAILIILLGVLIILCSQQHTALKTAVITLEKNDSIAKSAVQTEKRAIERSLMWHSIADSLRLELDSCKNTKQPIAPKQPSKSLKRHDNNKRGIR